jgi:small subunit ribosomal protein S8
LTGLNTEGRILWQRKHWWLRPTENRNSPFVHNFAYVDDRRQGYLRLYLKYSTEEESAIQGVKRISRPGLRRYVACSEIPRVLNGLGVAILSTSRGILTDLEARHAGVGGEVLCHVW